MAISNTNFVNTALYTVPNRAPRMLKRFYAETLLSRVMNREYEGELKKKGNKVTVPVRPVISVGDWTSTKEYTYPQLTAGAAVELEITEAKDFEFSINDIDLTQSYLKDLDGQILDEANQRLRIATETVILNGAPAKVAAANTGNAAGRNGNLKLGTVEDPVFLTSEKTYVSAGGTKYFNIVKYTTDLKTALDQQNITQSLEHFVIGDSMYGNLLANSDLKAANVTGDAKGVIRGGPDFVNKVQGMMVYQSNLYTPTTNSKGNKVFPVLFGVSDAWSFAAQMQDFQQFRHPFKAATAYRGMIIFGWNVMIDTAIGCGYVCFDDSI